jgi:hypothetical protein
MGIKAAARKRFASGASASRIQSLYARDDVVVLAGTVPHSEAEAHFRKDHLCIHTFPGHIRPAPVQIPGARFVAAILAVEIVFAEGVDPGKPSVCTFDGRSFAAVGKHLIGGPVALHFFREPIP